MQVISAGVDTWSPCWYVDPEKLADGLPHLTTMPGARGSRMLTESVDEHRVGWFPSGLVFAEGHPDGVGLAAPSGLTARALQLQTSLQEAGLPINGRQRALSNLGATSEGFAGLRRADVTIDLAAGSRAEGLAVLAGVAAISQLTPGKSQLFYGPDRGVETVVFRGHTGRRTLGRWYDKSLEAAAGPRGTIVRAEDQRRWAKDARRDVDELDGTACRSLIKARFAHLWKASKGVRVAGPIVIAERLVEAVENGEIEPRQAESVAGHILLRAAAGRRGVATLRTMYRREAAIAELGLVLADGVLEEVEVDLTDVLEQVLDTDAWDRCG